MKSRSHIKDIETIEVHINFTWITYTYKPISPPHFKFLHTCRKTIYIIDNNAFAVFNNFKVVAE